MAEKADFQSRVLFLGPILNEKKVFDKGIGPAFEHKAQVFRAFDGFAMSTMVVDDAYPALFAEIIHKWKIAFLVLGHSVGNLENAFGFAFRFAYGHTQVQRVVGRLQFQCFHIIVLCNKINYICKLNATVE